MVIKIRRYNKKSYCSFKKPYRNRGQSSTAGGVGNALGHQNKKAQRRVSNGNAF